MPQMGNITVKAANGTTDVVFTALSPAGADGSPAVWRVEDATKLPGERIRFELSSRWNAARNARKLSAFLNAPILRNTTVAGVFETVGNVQIRDGGAVVPQVAPIAFIEDATALYGNLMASALIKSSMSSGYSPN